MIWLDQVDAVSATATDDAFAFVGSARIAGTAGELRLQSTGGFNAVIVEADVTGNGAADMQILVLGTTTPTAEDFVL